MGTTTQGVKLDDGTRKRLAELGAIRDRSPHWLMREAINTYLDREERYEAGKREDMKRWEQYRLTGKSIPHETVSKWMDELVRGERTPCPK